MSRPPPRLPTVLFHPGGLKTKCAIKTTREALSLVSQPLMWRKSFQKASREFPCGTLLQFTWRDSRPREEACRPVFQPQTWPQSQPCPCPSWMTPWPCESITSSQISPCPRICDHAGCQRCWPCQGGWESTAGPRWPESFWADTGPPCYEITWRLKNADSGPNNIKTECVISAVNLAKNVMACVSLRETEAIIEMRLESFWNINSGIIVGNISI